MSGLFEIAVDRVKRNARLVLAAMGMVLSMLAGPVAAQMITSASVSPGSVQGTGQTVTFTVNYNSGTRVVSGISVASEIGAVYNCTGYSAGATNQNVTCVADYVTKVGDVGNTLNEIPVVTLVSYGVPTESTYASILAVVVTPPPSPVIDSITPDSGPISGGNSVTITGSNFIVGSTTVTFEWDNATNVVVNSPTSLTATVPAGVEGPVEVLVTTQGGATGYLSPGYTYLAPPSAPVVTGIAPSSGPDSGGTSVTITGTGFTNVTAVKFGGTPSTSVTVNSATSITARAPAGSVGMVDITVTTMGGTSAPSAAAQFTYAPLNTTLSSLSLSSGTLSPSFASGTTSYTASVSNATTSITVTPTVSQAGASVRVNGVAVTSGNASGAIALNVGANTITTVVTAQDGTTTKTYTITVTRAASSNADLSALSLSSGTLTPSFASGTTSYTASVANAATSITATPVVADATASVTVNGVAVSSGNASGAIALNVGANTVTTVVTAQNSATKTYTMTVTRALAAPTVTSISPTAGPATGGTTVVIIGTGFSGATAVTFGATAATGFTVDSATQITATAPAGTGTVDVRVTTLGGTSATSAGDQFTYSEAPIAGAVTATVAFGSSANPITPNLSGGPFTSVAVATAAMNGVATASGTSIAYTPNAGYFGADSFTYTATGPGGTSAAATVTLTVGTPGAPVAAAATVSAVYNTPTAIDLSGSITGVHTSLAVVAAPTHGTTSVSGDVVTYTPTAGYSGADSFTYTATGPGGTSAAATVTLTVGTPAAPVIDQPTAPVVVPPSGGASGAISVALGAGSHGAIDGYRITAVSQFGKAEVVSGASAARARSARSASPQAAASYRLTYTPAANFMGEDTVTLVAYGPGGDSTPVTFTFQVAGKAPDLSGETASDASATFAPTAGLIGGPFQTLRITRAPDFGTATVQGLTINFTPGVANGGATSLDYVIDLPFGASAPGRIDLLSNQLPGSEALVAQTLQGVPVTVRISNTAGGPFTDAAVVSMVPTKAGEASIAKVGDDYDLTFVSTGTFSGEAVVNYSLSNAVGTTNSTLTVTVEARPDPSLDPEVRGVATSQVTSARRFADAQINNFQQRLRDLHDGANGSSNGLSLNLGLGGADEDRDPQQALRRQLGQDRSRDPGALGADRDREMLGLDIWAGRAQSSAGPVGATDGHLNAASPQQGASQGRSVGLWTSGSVDWGRQDATGQRDSRFTTQGATVGLDVKVSDKLIVGGGVGYGEDKTRIGDNGSVTNGKAFTSALYASWRPAEAFYVDGVLGYADMDFTSRRWVEGLGGQSDGYADGDRSGDVRFASAAFGRVLRGERLTSDFYARLDARDIALDGFTETGGGLSALNWDEVEQKTLSANLGASWRWTLDSRRYGQFRPSARVEWSHELEDIGAQGVRYADWTASPTYLVPLDAWSRNAINLDLGTEWSLSDRLMLSLGYRGALGDASTSHGAQIGMKYGW